MLRIKISSVAKILIKISLIKKMLIASLSSAMGLLLSTCWSYASCQFAQPHVSEEKGNKDFCVCEIPHQCSWYKIAQCGPD